MLNPAFLMNTMILQDDKEILWILVLRLIYHWEQKM